MFDLKVAKKEMKLAISAAGLWDELALKMSRHPRTLKRWFSPNGDGMSVACLLLCAEYEELKPAFLAAIESLASDLRGQSECWAVAYKFKYKNHAGAPKESLRLLSRLHTVFSRLPGCKATIRESTDTGVAMLLLNTPYRPELIDESLEDELGIKYRAPSDFVDAETGLGYGLLIGKVYRELFNADVSDCLGQLKQHCTMLTPVRLHAPKINQL